MRGNRHRADEAVDAKHATAVALLTAALLSAGVVAIVGTVSPDPSAGVPAAQGASSASAQEPGEDGSRGDSGSGTDHDGKDHPDARGEAEASGNASTSRNRSEAEADGSGEAGSREDSSQGSAEADGSASPGSRQDDRSSLEDESRDPSDEQESGGSPDDGGASDGRSDADSGEDPGSGSRQGSDPGDGGDDEGRDGEDQGDADESRRREDDTVESYPDEPDDPEGGDGSRNPRTEADADPPDEDDPSSGSASGEAEVHVPPDDDPGPVSEAGDAASEGREAVGDLARDARETRNRSQAKVEDAVAQGREAVEGARETAGDEARPLRDAATSPVDETIDAGGAQVEAHVDQTPSARRHGTNVSLDLGEQLLAAGTEPVVLPPQEGRSVETARIPGVAPCPVPECRQDVTVEERTVTEVEGTSNRTVVIPGVADRERCFRDPAGLLEMCLTADGTEEEEIRVPGAERQVVRTPGLHLPGPCQEADAACQETEPVPSRTVAEVPGRNETEVVPAVRAELRVEETSLSASSSLARDEEYGPIPVAEVDLPQGGLNVTLCPDGCRLPDEPDVDGGTGVHLRLVVGDQRLTQDLRVGT